MNPRTRVALGVGAGYLLGRTRKMRWALMLAAAAASGKTDGGPRQLLQEGVSKLGSSGEVRKLTDNVRGDLLTSAKAAAVTAATRRVDALSDRLQAAKPQQDHGEAERGEQQREQSEEQPPSSARRRTTRRRSEPDNGAETTEESGAPRRRDTGRATSTGRTPVRRTRKK